MYFCVNANDRYYEKIMVGIPNFKPRGYGIGVIYQTVTATNTVTRNEMMRETVKNIRYPPFLRRFNMFLIESEIKDMRYKNQKHRDEFIQNRNRFYEYKTEKH